MSEYWYRDVVELSQDAIFVWCEGRFVFANGATARLLDAPGPESLVGMRIMDFVHPDSAPIAEGRQRKLLAEQRPLPPQELKVVRMDGQVIHVEAVATPFDYQGLPAAHVVLRDVSERKALHQEQLRRLQEDAELRRLQTELRHFRLLIEAIPNLAWTARPDGYLDYVNQRALDYLGLATSEIEGWSWQQVVHPDDLPECLRRWTHSLATGESYEVEMRLRGGATAAYRWHLVRALPGRDEQGQIVRWVGTSTDIHDQKQAETVLQQSHLRLEEAVRLRTQDLLAANVALRDEIAEREQVEKALRTSREKLRKLSAHLQSAREFERAAVAREIHDELGATLTAAKMGLHWYAKTLDEGKPPRIEKLAEAIQLVNSAIHTVKRISAELRPSILDHLGLWPALEWQLKEFERHFRIRSDIQLTPSGVTLPMDAQTAVFRIFQEALTNVARHSGATRVQVDVRSDGADVVVNISDNGIGLPPEKIMDPDSCGIQGMCERARTFGGEVGFAAREGGGTCVSIRFPGKPKAGRKARRDRETA